MTLIWILMIESIFDTLHPFMNEDIDIASTNFYRALTSLLPTGSIIWFLSIVGSLEMSGVGLHFSTLNSNSNTFHGFTVLYVWLCTVMSYFVFGFFIWYLDNVWPNQHGVAKSPLFMFYSSYWKPSQKILYTDIT